MFTLKRLCHKLSFSIKFLTLIHFPVNDYLYMQCCSNLTWLLQKCNIAEVFLQCKKRMSSIFSIKQ